MTRNKIRQGCFCEACKKPLTMIQTTPARFKKGGGRFCSRGCRNSTEKVSKFRPGFFCEVCDSPLLKLRTKPAIVKNNGGRFCSIACRDIKRQSVATPRHRPGRFCKFCNQSLLWERTIPSAIARGYGKFCSRECHSNWNSENLRGDKANNWRGGQAERKCEVCDTVFFVGPAKAKKDSGGRFCSTGCMGKWQSENNHGENAPSWKGGKKECTCEVCDSKFYVYSSIIERSGGRFCSKACHGQWNSENRVGENSARWMGGKSFEPYPPTFNIQFKRQIRQRDKHKCALCNEPARCVHHINYIKNDTVPENCITLCRSCHAATGGKRDYWQDRLTKVMLQRSFLTKTVVAVQL